MKHILIVEDEIDIRESLAEILELSGYQVSTANNGKEGLTSIIGKNPDLVLCDVNMPELDGFELLTAVNQRFKDKVVPPFLFLTAKVEKKDMRQGMSLGADDYILKPFDHVDILKTIELRLEKRDKLLNGGGSVSPSSLDDGFNKLALPSGDGLELVAFDQIVKCQADRAYCNFYLVGGRTVLVSKSMKEYEDVLTKKHFIKVHKSTIVNINYAEKYVSGKGGYLLLSDGSHVNVAVRKKEDLMNVLKLNG